jgi:hypothetical protein
MSVLRKLFGGAKSEGKATSDPLIEAARRLVDTNLPLARYLSSGGKFDRERMRSYIDLAEQSLSEPLDAAKKAQLLAADVHIMPRPMADGTFADGFEVMRWQLFDVHMEGVRAAIRLLGGASSAAEAAAYLQSVMKEVESLQRPS